MRVGLTSSVNLVALLVVAMLGDGANALEIKSAGQGDPFLRHGTMLDLQILDNRVRRREFQEKQQRFREEDRLTTGRSQQRLEIPTVRRNCQVQPYGNNFLRSCR